MGSPISQDVGVAVFAMTAPDFKTLLDARAQLIDEMYSGGFKLSGLGQFTDNTDGSIWQHNR